MLRTGCDITFFPLWTMWLLMNVIEMSTPFLGVSLNYYTETSKQLHGKMAVGVIVHWNLVLGDFCVKLPLKKVGEQCVSFFLSPLCVFSESVQLFLSFWWSLSPTWAAADLPVCNKLTFLWQDIMTQILYTPIFWHYF